VTEGILRALSRENGGVLSHELSHIKPPRHPDRHHRGDHRRRGSACWRRCAVGRCSSEAAADDDEGGSPIVALVMMIVAPIAAMLVQMAISRTRIRGRQGRRADRGNPYGLVNALQKLEQAAQAVPMQDAKPATAHMFIVNPLTGGGS